MRSKETIQQELTETRTRLSAYLAREADMLSKDGVQLYTIGSRNLQRYQTSLASVQDMIAKLQKRVRELEAELAGAMQSFQNELRDLIANGWIVELGDIGYFSVSLKGPRVMKKKDVHAQSIELKNVNFRVSSQFKKEVGQQMRLERGESMTRHHRKGHSEEECLTIINQHLNKYPCLTRTDYSRLTGHDKKRALKELNAFIERGLLIRYGTGKQVVYAKKTES